VSNIRQYVQNCREVREEKAMKQEDGKKKDRRILRTQQMLFDALVALVVEKGYEKITIQDITDRANVARTTFYLHFRDKEDLLINGIKAIFDQYLHEIREITVKHTDKEAMFAELSASTRDFDHIAQYADFYRIMLGPQGSPAFVHDFRNFLKETVQEEILPLKMLAEEFDPKLPLDLILTATIHTQLGLYMWWLQNDLKPDPKIVTNWSNQLMTKGVIWALGAKFDFPFLEDE
jgi:AcrR family transcriptional regulator